MKELLDGEFSVGDVVVDTKTNTITIAGEKKRLEPKLIALLVYFAQHAQQVIIRQQITDAIWPNVVVGEESISQAIFALRKALGDDAKRPKYIETIPKKGYRFLVNVTAKEPKTELPPISLARKPRWRARSIWAGLGLLGVFVLLWYKLAPRPAYEIANILPITKMSGSECCMAINNNRKMVFLNYLEVGADLYIKDLTSGNEERITQDDWYKRIPVWLDDNTLLYPRCLNSESECEIVQQHLNQSPQKIYSTTYHIGQLALMPNNPNVFIFNEQHHTNSSELISFDLRSGNYKKLRNDYPNLPSNLKHPVFSKDGSHLYFVNLDTKRLTIEALDLSSKKIQLVSDQFDVINSFSFDYHQQLMIAGIYNATAGIWLLDEVGGQPTLFMRAGNEELMFPLADPIEKTIYYQSVQFNRNVRMLSQNNVIDEFHKLNAAGLDILATLSNDEQFVYFISDRTGFYEAWRYDLDKKQTIPITHLKKAVIDRVLPSYNDQLFSARYKDNVQFMLGIFSMRNGELLASVKSAALPLSWSQNDKYIYVQDKINDIPVLVRYDSQTLLGTEIQKNAGLFAQESEDGTSIMFIDFEKNALVKRNIATGQDQVLVNMDIKLDEMWAGRLRINSTHSAVLVIKQNQHAPELWQYPFDSLNHPPVKLMDLPTYARVTFINGEGTKVLYEKTMPAVGGIMKIELR